MCVCSSWQEQKLYCAALNGNLGRVLAALDEGAGTNWHNEDHVLAGQQSELTIVDRNRYILHEFLNPFCLAIGCLSQGGDTPLSVAALHGRLQIVNLLLERRADPNLANHVILHFRDVYSTFIKYHSRS